MSIFGAIGGLIGGLLGNKSADKRQNQMLQWQEHMDSTKIQRLQKDAKAAGVHPLAAMGASLTSPSPVTVGGHADYSDIGQNIGRAVDATMSSSEKESDYTKAVQALTVQRMEKENNMLDLQLANSAAAVVRQVGNPPTFSSLPEQAAAASPRADLSPEKQETYTLFGKTFKQNPEFSAANRIQDVFGEPAEWPYAIVKMLAELDEHSGLKKFRRGVRERSSARRYGKTGSPRYSSGW